MRKDPRFVYARTGPLWEPEDCQKQGRAKRDRDTEMGDYPGHRNTVLLLFTQLEHYLSLFPYSVSLSVSIYLFAKT